MKSKRSALLLILCLLPTPILAQSGFGMRITPAGFDQLRAAAEQKLPPSFSVEAFEKVLFDCPGTRQVTGAIPATDIALGFDDLVLEAGDGVLKVSLVLDVNVTDTPLFIDNPYACFGEATCDISAGVANLGIALELAAGTSATGTIEFHGANVDLSLVPDDLNVESEGCTIGEITLFFFNTFESWILDLVIPKLETLLAEKIGAAMTAVTDEQIGLSVVRDDMTLDVSLNTMAMSKSDGLTASGDMGITWTGPSVFNTPAPATTDAEGTALPAGFGPGEFQLAVSDKMVTDALYEAWHGGMISNLLADKGLSLELGSDGIIQSLGLEAGTTIDVTFDIEAPLVASFGRSAPDVSSVALNGLHIVVAVSPVNGPSSTVDIMVEGSLAVALAVNQALGGLVLDITGIDIAKVEIDAGDTNITADRERLSGFVASTVTPLLAQRLSGVPVAPSLNPVAGVFMHVRSIASGGGWQRVGLDLVTADPNDDQAPVTSLVDPPTLVAAGTASVTATGTDDKTPTTLMRYKAWLDGEPLNEGVASGIAAIRFDVVGGDHVLEVAAVDLNDNEDPTRASHTFKADGTPPVLTLTESPGAVHTSTAASAAWTVSDAEGAVQTRWSVTLIGSDGTNSIIAEAPFAEVNSMSVGSLETGELYELEVIAKDVAGNVTSQQIGFAVGPDAGGCASAPRDGATWPMLALLMAMFLAVRTRRS